ncbi:exodeoxyribonuclease VII large subunit [Aliigemmobacter aestuarii]|uniref:Exodeoxyribonuclease 7 large subunit n=1 Tax=Aliigemmobacter aestuarii TaxID=1445661 RepID=A0A4S3MKH2_9RHOB|nr:exodeoxyribonuclease VII large subunit [Gemmobacter aestuarii]THD82253.1 exodeoxyribonuclease VII large subunit [Gemmobacter aestuarii]
MDIFEDTAPAPGNQPEYTVSELSGAVKRVIEGEFGLVRVRGEVGRVSRPSSGHLYFDLKDDRAVIAAVSWKGQVARMQVRPEEGMEVVATGRMTTFPGQSKYQLIVEDVAPAGAGALMAMLEKRRAALQAEGLFDPARKKPIPYLPGVIGVVTSPSGAVIRDILHRLRDRFPRHVLIWPVAVQGEKCAPEVAAAIRGFNAIEPGGPIPRPDVLIVARGGGSMEDLWGFNEEIVVRAAAASPIPLISAVGHETDTTLIDFAADLRAPTPTAAAELAVPVRLELLATNDALGARLSQALARGFQLRGQRMRDLARALPRPESLTGTARQRLDAAEGRLAGALGLMAARKRSGFEAVAGRLRPETLAGYLDRRREAVTARLARLESAVQRRTDHAHARFDKWASRLAPALARLIGDQARIAREGRQRLATLEARLDAAPRARLQVLSQRLAALDRTRQTLGHAETLKRGFAVVRADGAVVTSAAGAARAVALDIEFADGRVAAVPVKGAAPPAGRSRKSDGGGGPDQGSLF